MKKSYAKAFVIAATAASVLALSGCATRTVVVPKTKVVHHQPAKHQHIVYKVRPARKHCWRHRGHWDCA